MVFINPKPDTDFYDVLDDTMNRNMRVIKDTNNGVNCSQFMIGTILIDVFVDIVDRNLTNNHTIETEDDYYTLINAINTLMNEEYSNITT